MLGVGLMGTAMTQGLISYAANAAAPHDRGHVVGATQGGVFLGALLARVFAGGISDLAGWRGVYICSALLMLALALPLRKRLPVLPPGDGDGSYVRLLVSMLTLLREERVLRIRGHAVGSSMRGRLQRLLECACTAAGCSSLTASPTQPSVHSVWWAPSARWLLLEQGVGQIAASAKCVQLRRAAASTVGVVAAVMHAVVSVDAGHRHPAAGYGRPGIACHQPGHDPPQQARGKAAA